jgi:hypothetical protein
MEFGQIRYILELKHLIPAKFAKTGSIVSKKKIFNKKNFALNMPYLHVNVYSLVNIENI